MIGFALARPYLIKYVFMAEVLNSKQFFENFISAAGRAKKQIFLQSMLFESGKILDKLEPVLIKKAQEGVEVHVTIDWVSKRYIGDDANLTPKLKKAERERIKKIHESTEKLITRWSENGIIFTVTNKPNIVSQLLSIYRRNHIKMYLIDDTAAWIGGVNLFDGAVKFLDIMVKFTDPVLIDALSKQYVQVNNNRPQKNYTVKINPDCELLIDAGIMRKSLIYDTAAKLIKNAQSTILYASQFVPDGKVLKEIINASRRGVNVEILTNNQNHRFFTNFPYNLPYKNLQMKIKNKKNIKILYQNTKVHAKLLIVDEKTALFGSHNLVNIGVLLATEEIAICTKEKTLVEEIKKFIQNTLKA